MPRQKTNCNCKKASVAWGFSCQCCIYGFTIKQPLGKKKKCLRFSISSSTCETSFRAEHLCEEEKENLHWRDQHLSTVSLVLFFWAPFCRTGCTAAVYMESQNTKGHRSLRRGDVSLDVTQGSQMRKMGIRQFWMEPQLRTNSTQCRELSRMEVVRGPGVKGGRAQPYCWRVQGTSPVTLHGAFSWNGYLLGFSSLVKKKPQKLKNCLIERL